MLVNPFLLLSFAHEQHGYVSSQGEPAPNQHKLEIHTCQSRPFRLIMLIYSMSVPKDQGYPILLLDGQRSATFCSNTPSQMFIVILKTFSVSEIKYFHTIQYAKKVCRQSSILEYIVFEKSRQKVSRCPTTSVEILKCPFDEHFTLPFPRERNCKCR